MYYHSVTLDKDKCKGCTNCIKNCPTEAIRVRDGKARIIKERCIDCGECIRVCPYHAKVAVMDTMDVLNNFKYNIAIPAPTLFGQFKNIKHIQTIVAALLKIGFDDVYEVAKGADFVSAFIRDELPKSNKKPLISSACPAVVRLIQVRFPELISNIIRINSPMEVAAQLAKREFCEKRNITENQVGVFFISPCAAKMTSIKSPLGRDRSYVDGAISIVEIYGELLEAVNSIDMKGDQEIIQRASSFGLGWANSGGESYSLDIDNYLSVDGIHNVAKVLEEIENGKFNDLDFFEGLSCTGGCVGGPLTFENSYVARNRIRKLADTLEKEYPNESEIEEAKQCIEYALKKEIMPKPVMKLDDDIQLAVLKMERIEQLEASLPGLDCGSCGSPSCRALAEDIVRGYATEMDCVFKLREMVSSLAEQMVELSRKMPSAIKEEGKQDEG